MPKMLFFKPEIAQFWSCLCSRLKIQREKYYMNFWIYFLSDCFTSMQFIILFLTQMFFQESKTCVAYLFTHHIDITDTIKCYSLTHFKWHFHAFFNSLCCFKTKCWVSLPLKVEIFLFPSSLYRTFRLEPSLTSCIQIILYHTTL